MISPLPSMVMGVSLILFAFSSVRGDAPSFPLARASDIDQKLRSIIVSVDFTNANLDEAIRALSDLSKRLDPDHRRIQFLVQPEASATAKPITLKLNKVPVGVALHYVCELSLVHSEVSDDVVFLKPLSGEEWFVKRTYHVDPDFVKSAASVGVIPSPQAP